MGISNVPMAMSPQLATVGTISPSSQASNSKNNPAKDLGLAAFAAGSTFLGWKASNYLGAWQQTATESLKQARRDRPQPTASASVKAAHRTKVIRAKKSIWGRRMLKYGTLGLTGFTALGTAYSLNKAFGVDKWFQKNLLGQKPQA
jgi:hypothetical protein